MNNNLKRIYPDDHEKEIFSSTPIKVIEIHPRSHKHSSQYDEKQPRLHLLLEKIEKERIKEYFLDNIGGKIAVELNSENSNIARIEFNSSISHGRYRETALDLHNDGHLKEIHRLEHSNEERYNALDKKIKEREYYYSIKKVID